MYAPRHFEPRRIDAVVSQLDVAPTVLGMLGFSYDSAFFGRDVLAASSGAHAVPLNHNRDIALLQGDRLNELGFRRTTATIEHETRLAAKPDEQGLRDAASLFQLAYTLYSKRQYGAH